MLGSIFGLMPLLRNIFPSPFTFENKNERVPLPLSPSKKKDERALRRLGTPKKFKTGMSIEPRKKKNHCFGSLGLSPGLRGTLLRFDFFQVGFVECCILRDAQNCGDGVLLHADNVSQISRSDDCRVVRAHGEVPPICHDDTKGRICAKNETGPSG